MTWEVTDVLLNSKQYLLHWVNPRGVGPNRTVCVGGGDMFSKLTSKRTYKTIFQLYLISISPKSIVLEGDKNNALVC